MDAHRAVRLLLRHGQDLLYDGGRWVRRDGQKVLAEERIRKGRLARAERAEERHEIAVPFEPLGTQGELFGEPRKSRHIRDEFARAAKARRPCRKVCPRGVIGRQSGSARLHFLRFRRQRRSLGQRVLLHRAPCRVVRRARRAVARDDFDLLRREREERIVCRVRAFLAREKLRQGFPLRLDALLRLPHGEERRDFFGHARKLCLDGGEAHAVPLLHA